METLTHEEGELVSVLTGSRDPDRARPVVVEVSQLVGQLLQVLGLQTRGVLHHVVAGGVHSSLGQDILKQ